MTEHALSLPRCAQHSLLRPATGVDLAGRPGSAVVNPGWVPPWRSAARA